MTFVTKLTLESSLCNYIEMSQLSKKIVIEIEGIVRVL